MKATELIAQLQALVAEHGDLDTFFHSDEWGGYVAANLEMGRDFLAPCKSIGKVWKPQRGWGTPALVIRLED